MTNNDFKNGLVVPTESLKIQEKKRTPEDEIFLRKVEQLTRNFSTDLPLYDSMIMYAYNKSAKKMNMDEFERYQSLVEKLIGELEHHAGNYSATYEALLDERTGLELDSVEREIIERYYRNLNKDSIDR